MKIKKMLSVLLAAVMAFSLLCSPAFAASPTEVEKALDNGSFWVDMKEYDRVEKNVSVKLRLLDWNSSKYEFTKRATPYNYTISELIYLPLGVTITAGPNFGLDYIYVYSDPDGDGIYEQRLERDIWYGEGDDEDYDYEIVPLSESGPFAWTDDIEYSNYFEWGAGNDWLEWKMGMSVYRTLSTDYLVEQFGPNSIIEFSNNEGTKSNFYLLTGEDHGESVADDKIENYGVTVSIAGYLTSTWASQTVDVAYLFDLVPPMVERNHNYNLRGEITRGEFAAVAVLLYEAMSGEEALYTDTDPFVDVEADTVMYQYIMAARDLGIVKGTSATAKTFKPDTLVTRQDAAVMLSRVYEAVGGKIPAASSTSFADNGEIASYAKSAVAFMTSKGIIDGVGDNRFSPKGDATVEQSLKISLEMLNKLG